MKQIVIMPGGFHPFHAGHAALYQSAVKAFPNADVYVAATNDTKTRPFPFTIKEKLAKLAGVAPGRFVQVKSPFQPKEITSHYNPDEDILIYVRSEKDRNESPKPGGMKKDGTPAYLQPYTGKNLQPFGKHAYIAYLPTVEFGPGITSATEIRKAWPTLDDRRKTAMVMSLYPATQKNPKLASNVVKMLDMGMGEQVDEGLGKTLGTAALAGSLALGGLSQMGKTTTTNWNDYEQQISGSRDTNGGEKIMSVAGPNSKGEYRVRITTDNDMQEFITKTPPKSLDENIKVEPIVKPVEIQPTQIQPKQHVHIPPEKKTPAVVNHIKPREVKEDKDPIISAVLRFYKPVVDDIHKEKLPDYVDQARHLLHKTDDPDIRKKLVDIFKKGKENPYIQGGIVTTVGAVLAGGVLSTAQKMGLSPAQTNLALQAILNTVIPTVVSRINGKSWSDTIKYTLASAGIGTGIAGAGLIEANPNQQMALYNPDGKTYRGEKMPTLNNPDDIYNRSQSYDINDMEDEPTDEPNMDASIKELIKNKLDLLEPRERKILQLRYWHDMTLRDIADRIGVNPARVSQIEARAMRKIQKATLNFNPETLKMYVPESIDYLEEK